MLSGHTFPSNRILGFEKVRPSSCRVADTFKLGIALELTSILLNDMFICESKSKPWLKSTLLLKLIFPEVVTSTTKLVMFLMLNEDKLLVEPLKRLNE